MKARPPLSRRIKDAGLETALFRRRALAGFAIIACCLAVLLARFFWLQVLRHDEFSARSDANRIKIRPLPPARGLIYDRNGVVLADNVPQYRLELTPEQAGDVADTDLERPQDPELHASLPPGDATPVAGLLRA